MVGDAQYTSYAKDTHHARKLRRHRERCLLSDLIIVDLGLRVDCDRYIQDGGDHHEEIKFVPARVEIGPSEHEDL